MLDKKNTQEQDKKALKLKNIETHGSIKTDDSKTAVANMSEKFSNATGIELVTETAKYVCVGIFMGSSDAIPGYSGATTLALIGYFKTLMLLARSVFIPEKGITRFRALLLIMPFVVG